MNKLKQYNYTKYLSIKNYKLQNKTLILAHYNYITAKDFQSFFSYCKENNIKILKIKLNLLKKNIFLNNNINSLLSGPSIILISKKLDLNKIKLLENKYNFLIILSYLFKNKILCKKYIDINYDNIISISKKLSIPSKLFTLFFFKKFILLFPKVIIKPIINLFLLLNFKCLR